MRAHSRTYCSFRDSLDDELGFVREEQIDSVNRVFAMAWALAGAAGAIGGVLLASIAGSYGIELESFAIFVFPVVILGGLDSVLGTVVGGIIVGLLVEYSKSYLTPSWSVILPFLALVAILLVKPYGLFGQVRIERV